MRLRTTAAAEFRMLFRGDFSYEGNQRELSRSLEINRACTGRTPRFFAVCAGVDSSGKGQFFISKYISSFFSNLMSSHPGSNVRYILGNLGGGWRKRQVM